MSTEKKRAVWSGSLSTIHQCLWNVVFKFCDWRDFVHIDQTGHVFCTLVDPKLRPAREVARRQAYSDWAKTKGEKIAERLTREAAAPVTAALVIKDAACDDLKRIYCYYEFPLHAFTNWDELIGTTFRIATGTVWSRPKVFVNPFIGGEPMIVYYAYLVHRSPSICACELKRSSHDTSSDVVAAFGHGIANGKIRIETVGNVNVRAEAFVVCSVPGHGSS